MNVNKNRLYFIDAIRAWAILMMLQGHFIDGLLGDAFRDTDNTVYLVWRYFRGITAPVFFTVSGFIFTYLLVRVPEKGFKNPRIKKGLKRGLELIFIGYLLRSNIFGLFKGKIYHGFLVVDVLHCIGLSILAIIAIYLISNKISKYGRPVLYLAVTLCLFTLEPLYPKIDFLSLPLGLQNYFVKTNGSIFTIIPWLGYTTFGAFLAIILHRFRDSKNLFKITIPLFLAVGVGLLFGSSPLFEMLSATLQIDVFHKIAINNFLYIRLGDVLIVFAIFMALRNYWMNKTFLRIGQNTLSIYVIHFIILYGSLTGFGLYRFFVHSLSPIITILGAILFMFVCAYLALLYDRCELEFKNRIRMVFSRLVSFCKAKL